MAKNRKRKKYNRKQFRTIVCKKCTSCATIKPDPTFCYDFLYTDGSDDQRKKLISTLIKEEGFDINFFEEKFCTPEICANISYNKNNYGYISNLNCLHVSKCYKALKSQLDISNKNIIVKIKKSNRKKERYVAKPYTTFIISSKNEEWFKKVNNIMYEDKKVDSIIYEEKYAGDNRKQDNNKECSESNTRTFSKLSDS